MLDDLVFVSQGRTEFFLFSIPSPWVTQPPLKWLPGLFHGDKVTRVWHWPPTLSGAKVNG